VAAGDGWLLTQTGERPVRLLLAAGAAAALLSVARAGRGRPAATVATAAAVLSVSVGVWIGANSPRVSWFGSLISHGSRDSRQVALTFDDGPNATATLAVRDILDAHGVKGSFFLVGQALDTRPDLARALLSDGHLLANHSYRHDSIHWLDPRYGELGSTQRAFARNLGLCPAYFRPPHGQHTPLMAAVVRHHSMAMVGWDVSVGDWSARSAERVADNVLRKARPGSIIVLHDGLDGRVNADRGVLVRAMPLILDGLARQGLHPVRLDELLGRPGYLPACPVQR
jgi:peptidoglycan/xylan/chitin deacetylase (PgdA/CDA1 family)